MTRPSPVLVFIAGLPVVLAAGAMLWSPASPVTGTAHALPAPPAPVVQTAPVPTTTLPPPPPPPPPARSTAPAPPATSSRVPAPPAAPVVTQAPGTVRLPSGSTAQLVRQEVVGGVLPVPKGLGEAAWWGADLDATRGASVFAGHVNWGGHTGPFAELWHAQAGQLITVVAPDGRRAQYRISQLISVDKGELPQRAPDLFAQTGPHRLVLVTCGGEWIGGEQGYADNRVAIADPA
ncbi:class F sortase [Amycolatopsis sp. GM8]|uniref:class F sortase n=1 Tax=Amycolatopsis sp. GM8 TaxID=2896530 RepID=UPI001F2F7EAD|nr:class F sortase [Amycolatopsis sp. GM8]